MILNLERLYLLANLVDHSMEQNFDNFSELIQNSATNILKMLPVASEESGNIIFDPTMHSEITMQSVSTMKDVTETVLSSIILLYKIIFLFLYSSFFIVILCIIVCTKVLHAAQKEED